MHLSPSITVAVEVSEELIRSMIGNVRSSLDDEKLRWLASGYRDSIVASDPDIGFNVFRIVSNIYHRENLHSDVMATLLDPSEAHGKGRLFLDCFIELLASAGILISRDDFPEPKIEREKGRIDILVYDLQTAAAIIIENKINDAVDQPRQIPTYLSRVKARGFHCTAIAYIPKTGTSRPDIADWTQQELGEISAILVTVPGYDGSQSDLYSGWLGEAILAIPEPDDVFHICRHYAAIIQEIGAQNMNKPLMAKFYAEMNDAEKFQSALALESMLKDLPRYRAQRFLECFSTDTAPYASVDIWKDLTVYFTGLWSEGVHFGIDVWIESEKTVFGFWQRTDGITGLEQAEATLKEMGLYDQFTRSEHFFIKAFPFPDKENDLYDFTKNFKSLLARLLDKRKLTKVA